MSASDPFNQTSLNAVSDRAQQAHLLHQNAYSAIATDDLLALKIALIDLRDGKHAIKLPDLWKDAARQGRLEMFDVLASMRDGNSLMREDFLHAVQGAVIGQQQAALNWLTEKCLFIFTPEENMQMAMLCARHNLVDEAKKYINRHMGAAIQDDKKDKLFFKYLEICIEHDRAELALDVIEQRFKNKDRRFDDYHELVTKAVSESKREILVMLVEQGDKWLSQKHLADVATKLALQIGSETALDMVVSRLDDLQAVENDLLRNLLYRMGPPTKEVLAHPLPDTFFKVMAVDGNAARLMNVLDNFEGNLEVEDGLRARLEKTAQDWRDHHEPICREKYNVDRNRKALLFGAAKHNVLDVFLRDKTLPPLEPQDWENTGLLTLLMANGHIARVIAPDLWVGRTDALCQLLAELPRDKASKIGGTQALSEARRLSLAARPRARVTFSGGSKKP